MPNKKVNLAVDKNFQKPGLGVLEWWSIGVLKKDINPSNITPTLHYSNTPKLLKFKGSTKEYHLFGYSL